MKRNGRISSAPFEHAWDTRAQRYILCLFITGMTPRSTQAVAAIKQLCEDRLAGRYELKIVDLYQYPEEALHEQIVAAPTLVRQQPLPERRLIGTLADRQRVLTGLGLVPATLD